VTSDLFTAFTATNNDGVVTRAVEQLSLSVLPTDGVLIDVAYSSVNYKDGLATTAKGKVARISPIIPGIDLSGVVAEDGVPGFPKGTRVVAHGYDLGVSRHGGFAQKARVPADWLVALPDGLDLKEAMTIGTAGFTAALSVLALEERGLTPAAGKVLVTGATGGVGSIAVGILSAKGYEVDASTGKASAEAYLRSIGATNIIDRNTLSAEGGKPLQSMQWAAAVDCVGGNTLANVLASINYGGAVAASGLTGGAGLNTTVMPFILRNVALLGIDSVQTDIVRRRDVWNRMGSSLKPAGLGSIAKVVALGAVEAELDTILAGGVTGRVVVDVNA
jgi:putative YhdH/YhfP family quinone oxidoreductase